MRYDPEVHDPRRLEGADAAKMSGFDLCDAAIQMAFDDEIEARAAKLAVGSFARTYLEVAEDVREALERRVDRERIGLCVAMMDASPDLYYDDDDLEED